MLDVPVSYFFDEMPSNALSGRPMSGRGRKGFGEAGTPFEQEKDPLIKRETLELVRAYYKIRESRCASASSRWSRQWVRRAMPRSWAVGSSADPLRRTEWTDCLCWAGYLCSRRHWSLHHPAPLRALSTATRSSRAPALIARGASTRRGQAGLP